MLGRQSYPRILDGFSIADTWGEGVANLTARFHRLGHAADRGNRASLMEECDSD